MTNVTRTANWIAAARARESARPDALFVDPFARELAGDPGFSIMAASEKYSGKENTFIPVRVRWFDDTIEALATPGAQVVLLGAGLDTRPYRLALPSDLAWYELDQLETFAAKEPVVGAATPRCRRYPVPADLAVDWVTPLLAAGFDRARPTVWVAEGLFYYLSRPVIQSILTAARDLGADGVFLADVMPASIVERLAKAVHRPADVPPPFGTDDPVGLFAAGGWPVTSVTAPGAPEANFGRFHPLPPGLHPGHVHLVHSRQKPAGGWRPYTGP